MNQWKLFLKENNVEEVYNKQIFRKLFLMNSQPKIWEYSLDFSKLISTGSRDTCGAIMLIGLIPPAPILAASVYDQQFLWRNIEK